LLIESRENVRKQLTHFNLQFVAKGPCELFYAMYQYASRPEVEKQISKQQNSLPHDLLQRGIASLSSSPETYLFIRAQFAKTLAVFNIASYIVGIGDRHLENFLLDMNSY
jgi:DNA-dependent protein kinase catalytic subunit